MLVSPPQVTVRLPGDEETSWVDLTEQLNRNRILFLCEELDTDISNDIIGLMLYFGMGDNTQDLYLFINSPGGEILNGIAVHNVMQFVPTPVSTICLGMAASTAAYILVGGEYKKRVAFPHARIMIHNPSITFFADKKKTGGINTFKGIRRTFVYQRNRRKGLLRKNGQTPLDYIPRFGKRFFYVSNRS